MKSPDGKRECSIFCKHRRIALRGRRTSTLYLENPRQIEVEQIEVDGCAITEGPRCDWLVRVIDDKPIEEIFVELKGAGVSPAIIQLRESITKLSVQKNTHQKRAVIVFTRNPMSGTDIQIQKVKFFKDFRASLVMVKNNQGIPL
jgi:hypothetical protein